MGIFRRRSKDLFTIPAQPAFSPPATSAPGSAGFRMVVEDVFFIQRRGMVVTGTIEAGTVAVGSLVTLERAGQAVRSLQVAAIEQARKTTAQAGGGETVGLLLRDAGSGEIVQGDVLRT